MREFLVLTFLSLFVALSTLEAEAATTVIDSDTSIANLVINPGDTLQINSGVNLIITGTLENFGTINNDGTILNFGTINNQAGIIEINAGAILENSGGTINNQSGFIIINAQGTIINGGVINNEGILENLSGGVLENLAGGRINNDGIIDNDGTIENDGVISASTNSIINNSGDINGNQIQTSGSTGGSSSSGGSGSSGDEMPPQFDSILFSKVLTQLDDKTFRYGNITSPEIKFSNSFPTATVQRGQPFTISLVIFENSGTDSLDHISLYTNLRDTKRDIHYSDTRIIYNKGSELSLYDSSNLLSNANVTILKKGAHIEAIFDITFQDEMELSDIIIRAWDDSKNSVDAKFLDAIKVVSPSELVDIEINVSDGLGVGDIDKQPEKKESEKLSRDSIIKWGGLSTEIISDTDLLNMAGLDGDTIPRWFKSNIPSWIMQDRISQEEFVNALNFFYENGLLNSAN